MAQTTFEQLGPYRIDRVLGRGGMGTVFAAMDERTAEWAAVKVLAPGLAEDETFRERFAAEIESLKKLHHPHIVQLYGFGEQDGHLFYAMELVDGSNLEQELRAGRRFTWRDVTRMGIEICGALKQAHDHGVIHRDLKPANLLLGEDEQIKLSDFGIAKLFGFTQMTVGGNVMGTADYMAPEQAEGKATTPRCDLYSLGCVMYALLAGRPPFSGNTIAEVVHKLRYEQALPIQQLASDVPDELARIIHELLEKDPERRIRTALALSHRLKAMEHALSVRPREDDELDDEGGSDGFVLQENAGADDEPPPDIAHRTTVSLPEDAAGISTGAEVPESEEDAPELEPQIRTHFTPVDTSVAWHEDTPAESTASMIAVKVLGVAVLAALGMWLWYNLQPLTSDQLYRKIDRIVYDVDQDRSSTSDEDEKDRIKRLYSAEVYIRRFLAEFPHDSHSDEINKLAEEIELHRLERKFATRARRPGLGGALLPVEQTYLAAIRQSQEDPDGAITLLRGLIELYTHQEDGIEPDTLARMQACVELSKKQIERLQDVVDDTSTQHGKVLAARLSTADQLRDSDPEDAMAIWRGIISLYSDKPWAADYVRQARECMDQRTAAGLVENTGVGQSSDE